MTIFPHAETLCTRMRIQVRLRRGALTAPRLEVFNHIEGRTEGSPIIVPIESAVIDVREAMERLIRERNQGLVGVTTSHSLILHVRSPNIPTLDLVDLPGVVVCAAEFLGKLSATVRIKHSVHDLTSTISVDTDKIIGAVVQLYAENRLYAIKVELPDKIRAVVHAALDENTQDACHAERLELLEQMANIEKAQQGIRAVALKAVSFAIQHWTRTQLAIPVCLP